PADLNAYTLPTYAGVTPAGADVLYVNQPTAQQLLVKVFGQVGTAGGLTQPTNPPPNSSLATPPPPVVATPVVHHPVPGHHHPTTTTTVPLHSEPWYTFNPTACTG
ncbi:MAG TPA: hypothetical protein VIE15_04150, partial [Acidimicrobiales bacterium]